MKARPNVAERLALRWKTVSFGLVHFKPFQTGTAPDNEARMADRLPGQMIYAGCLERRSRVLSVVFCGAMAAVLSTLVDNHVDSSWSQHMVVRRRQIRGTHR
jgi:hypothetical protein